MNRKSKIKNILISSLILAVAVLTAGCKHNLTDNNNSSAESSFEYVILKLNLGLSGRQASPSLDEDVLTHLRFKVTAKNHATNKTATTVNDEDFFVHNQGSDNPYEYKIKLDSGIDWDVTVTGYYGDPSEGIEILQGEKLVSVQSNGSYFEEIELFFITTSKTANSGNVDLEIDVTAVPEITNLKILQSGNGNLNGTYSVTEEAAGKRIIHITPVKAITSGNYNPILSFCNADDVTIISIPETITVTKNMTTKYWFSSTQNQSKATRNPFLSAPDSNGYSTFVLTHELISQSLNTIFYISGNTSIGKATNSGNDYSSQLNNLDNAFKRINAINNNDYGQASSDSDFIQHFQRNFIIFVSERAVAPGTSASPFTADHPLKLSIYPIGTARLPVTNYLKVGRNINLTMENLTINNAFTCDDNSTVLAENVNFSKAIYVGHDAANNTTDEIHNTAILSMINCSTIGGVVYCYASADGSEKCSITATNCTFNNSLTNKGNVIATDTNIDKNYSGSGGSTLVLVTSDNNSESNYIKGSVTLENTASAIIRNTRIGEEVTQTNSINIKNTSSATLENVEITKGIDAQSSITFLGNTHFTGNISSESSSVLSLKDGVVLKIGDMSTGTSKLAAIKVASPSSNLPVIQAIEGQEATSAQIARFELHNPGYYLGYDAATKKGIVKLSWGQIQEPTFGGCTIHITGNITSGDDDIWILARGENPQSITVTAKDSANNPLVIKSVKQYLGNSVISSTPESTVEQTQKTLSFERSIKETYGLEITFIYNEIEYSEMFTVKIQ